MQSSMFYTWWKESMQYPIQETKTPTKQLIYTGNIQQYHRDTHFKTPEKFIKKILKSNMNDAYVMNISDYDNNETQFLTRMSKCL